MNVLFLLVDCLKADITWGTDRRVKTPTLDALREQGTFATQVISVAGSTPVCLASLFTGVYPFVHGIRPLSLNRFHLSTTKLNPNCPTLAEILRQSGYATCATTTGPILHVTDLDRGFDQYTHRATDDVYLHQHFSRDLRRLVQSLDDTGKPWLLFAHLWELHAPRQVLPEFNSSRYGSNRYERAVSSFDHQLAAILQSVDFTNTLVIIHGDHGEGTGSLLEFMLHPFLYEKMGIEAMRLFYGLCFRWIHRYRVLQSAHGLNLYDEMVRVPLILAGPGVPKGCVIREQVSQIDILPTLLDLAGAPPGLWPPMQGRSLLPLIKGNPWVERPVYSEAYSGRSISLRHLPIRRAKAGTFPKPPALAAIRTSEWKCIWVPEDPRIPTELYHLTEDPLEKENLFSRRRDVAEELKSHLARLESGWQPGAQQATMSPEEQAILEDRLRELGYL